MIRKIFATSLFALSFFASTRAFALDAPEPTRNALYRVSANWSNLQRGRNTLQLHVSNQDNQPVEGATVTVDYNMVDMNMNPPNLPVEEVGGGDYTKSVTLGMRGNWFFDITITKDGTTDTLHKVKAVQ